MTPTDDIIHSRALPLDQPGELIQLPREAAGWKWMSFFVRRLTPGMAWECRARDEEVALVLLGGQCVADWGQGKQVIGGRKNVFDGFPHALYLHRWDPRHLKGGNNLRSSGMPGSVEGPP